MIAGGQGLFRQSFFSCLKISQFISLHFNFQRYFYNGSENNKLESGGIRVNMLTRRFGFPCIGRMAKNFRADFELFMEKKKISFPFK